VALTGVELYQFFGALVLLGIGWNFGFIGATALLTQSHAPEERGRVQGMNDFFVFGCVTVASLASGFLMSSGRRRGLGLERGQYRDGAVPGAGGRR
jgi:MFS family permease